MSKATVQEQGIISKTTHIQPEKPVYMMGHIGGIRQNGKSDELDHDIKQTREQKKLIDISKDTVYKRIQHDERFDLPDRGIDLIQNVHPLGVTMLANHSDKGYDYRDFPQETAKKHELYDPYIGFLYENNLIGKVKSRYNVNYVLIDSSYRNKDPETTISTMITLNNNPLSFNGQHLVITMSDTSTFTPNSKITIRGISPKQLTLRSMIIDDFGNNVNYFLLQNGVQFMTVTADTNMNISSGLTPDIRAAYVDMSVTFNGFTGDTRTDWYFDTTNYIWKFDNVLLSTGEPGFLLTLTENVHAVTAASSTLPEEKQIREDMLIAQFTLDVYGNVVGLNNGFPYDVSDLRWTEPPEFAGQGTAPVSVPSNFNTLVEAKLISNSLTNGITLPNNLFTAMSYIQNVQNTARPIFLALMSDSAHKNFSLRYTQAGQTYVETVRLVVPESTKVTTSTQIGNISLNMLNATHRMYLTSADVARDLGIYDPMSTVTTDIPTPNKFYIKLSKAYQKRPFIYSNPLQSGALAITIFQDTKSDVTITYNHYGGIPINVMTAQLPIGFSSIVAYKYITQVVDNSYITVDLGIVGFFTTTFGGSVVSVSLVDDISSGYSQPNRYSINLEKTYKNVVMVKMISSIFPVTHNAIADGSAGGRKNNAFYWQNLDDSDIVYKIEIDSGDYSALELKTAFESAVTNVFRVIDQIVSTIRNIITIDIDEKTNKVVFTSYNEYSSNGVQTFISATNLSTINQSSQQTTSSSSSGSSSGSTLSPEDAYYKYPNGGYFKSFNVNLNIDSIRIIVYQPGNNLRINDTITIRGSLNFENIPASYMNGQHIVTRVSGDYYDFLLNNVNPDSTLDTTIKGGNAILIYTPNFFRIRFDYQDTLGEVLGFRDVGQSTSITPYAYIITNDVIYEGENSTNVTQEVTDSNIDSNSISAIPVRNSLDLKGPQYIIISCKELPNITSPGPVKDLFYVVYLNGKFGTYVRNTFSKTPIFYNDPLEELSTLSFDIYFPDGTYYDFNGVDHSFVLQIVTYNELPEETAIRK